MTSKLTANVASLPDRENVVYEIFYGSNQVAEISNEPEVGLRIEIFNCPEKISWNFSFYEFNSLIEQAVKNIT
ncbi:hypothetical protein J9874_03908 (plasmid) [Duffyella gerundensis]|uniref:hypothetical protein n=1 Tax=Duffyella gerundensis TaxID=1619313 RepID=UPI001CE24F9F|nr:hypothetical protein [Duffyella gerundensis]UCB33325.1 hypothetical protein J9874_03908 [Duffyella gerundensis]